MLRTVFGCRRQCIELLCFLAVLRQGNSPRETVSSNPGLTTCVQSNDGPTIIPMLLSFMGAVLRLSYLLACTLKPQSIHCTLTMQGERPKQAEQYTALQPCFSLWSLGSRTECVKHCTAGVCAQCSRRFYMLSQFGVSNLVPHTPHGPDAARKRSQSSCRQHCFVHF